MIKIKRLLLITLVFSLYMGSECNAQTKVKIWHTLIIDFEGPQTSEQAEYNPFTNYRLNVSFRHEDTEYIVPGYYAADGNAAETSAISGNVWRVKFTPDAVGKWTYKVSFRKGENIAISLDSKEGKSYSFDGEKGSFMVEENDEITGDFRTQGLLKYVGKYYLQFQGSKKYFIKGGTDSPENLLAYHDFDNTLQNDIHFYAHEKDWQKGDPVWQRNRGKGLIGAINYLSDRHVNSLYFMPNTIGGDGKDVHPFSSENINYKGDPSNDNLRYDVSKLAQWDIVFEHAQRKGLMLNAVLNEGEVENKNELDNARLGIERKLYYRELVARLGHHNALQWNLCEEYNGGGATGWRPLDPALIKEWAAYLSAIDPYDHPMTVHTVDLDDFWDKSSYGPFLGNENFDLTSIQAKLRHFNYGKLIEEGRKRSADAGRPWVISFDESKLFNTFANRPDDQDIATQNRARREIIWPTYISGGAGHEWISVDWNMEDFRKLEGIWDFHWYARKFFLENLPFWEMEPADSLLHNETELFGGGQVFALPGKVYAVYLPCVDKIGELDLTDVPGDFNMQWYDTRTGKFIGDPIKIKGGALISLGNIGGANNRPLAPDPPDEKYEDDWAILITRDGFKMDDYPEYR